MFSHYSEQFVSAFETIKVLKQNDEKCVRLVRHKTSGQKFVIRIFPGNPSVYQKLLPVKSQSLPQIFMAEETDGTALVLEEYIQGDSLSDMLKSGLFSAKETRSISVDICRALYVLHSLQIVHRDVKPDNIILREDHAVLLDFDASRSVKNVQQTDTVSLGTTGYAPPEQYGISQTDRRADIYALGVTMNLMLTGEHPSVKLASGRMGRIISKCTNVNPGKRYNDTYRLMKTLLW